MFSSRPAPTTALVQLQQNGVASFRTPESCADAVNAYLNWHAPGERLRADAEVHAASQIAQRFELDRLSERDAGTLFDALGIRIADYRVISKASDTVDLPGPFAVKLLSPDVLHKTDAGMVALDVRTRGCQRTRPGDARGCEGALPRRRASKACWCSRWSAASPR